MICYATGSGIRVTAKGCRSPPDAFHGVRAAIFERHVRPGHELFNRVRDERVTGGGIHDPRPDLDRKTGHLILAFESAISALGFWEPTCNDRFSIGLGGGTGRELARLLPAS